MWVRVGAFEMKQQMGGALSGKVFAPTKEPAERSPVKGILYQLFGLALTDLYRYFGHAGWRNHVTAMPQAARKSISERIAA